MCWWCYVEFDQLEHYVQVKGLNPHHQQLLLKSCQQVIWQSEHFFNKAKYSQKFDLRLKAT